MNMHQIDKWAYEQEANNAIIKVFNNGTLIRTLYCTEKRKQPEEMSVILMSVIEEFQKSKGNVDKSIQVLLSNIDNEPFLYVEFEYRLFLAEGRFEIWRTKKITENGLNRWEAGFKISDRTVTVVNAPKEVKKPAPGKGAEYLYHWIKPEVVGIRWGDNKYEYFLDGTTLLNRYLWLRRQAGENKAALWLKKNAYKSQKVV